MANFTNPVTSKVQESFRDLAKTASQLNFVSDALGKYISEIEDAFKSINLGVASWVTIEVAPTQDGIVWVRRELGYDKIAKNWCIALRSMREAEWSDEPFDYELWTFNEGPRWLRIKAVDHLPALIQKLNSDAANISKHVSEKLPDACSVASGINAVVAARNEQTKGKVR